MPSVYALDIDNTLNIPGSPYPGPVDLRDVVDLKNRGNIVGIAGNYYVAFKFWRDVFKVINFWGPMSSHNKASFLGAVKMDIARTQPQYNRYLVVGNKRDDAMKGLVLPSSQDDGWARLAGWSFLSETEFAQGRR